MHLAPTLRLFAHVLSASLILTGLVLPATALTAAAASCGTTNVALNKTATASSTQNASFPASAAVDGNTGHTLVQRVLRPAVAGGRPRLIPVDLPGRAGLGDRLRQGIPDPDLRRRLHLDHHLLHHHRHRRHPDPQHLRYRPLHPHVRHHPRHPVRLLPHGNSSGLRHQQRRRTRASRPPAVAAPGSRTHRTSARTSTSSTPACPAPASSPRWTPSSTRKSSTSSVPSATRCCSSRAPTAWTPTSATTPLSRAWARTRTTSRSTAMSPWTRSTARATPRRTSGARRRTWRSTRLPGRPLGRGAGRAVPPDRRARRTGALSGQLRLRQRRLHRRHQGLRPSFHGVPAAVVLQRQQLRQLERLGVEHGVLRRDRRTGPELPQPADDDAGHDPGRTRRAVPLHRLVRQLPRLPAVASDERVRRQLGQRLDARHLAADEPVLRGHARPTPRRRSTRHWPKAATCSSPRASTTSTRRSTSPTRTRWCWASGSRR